MKLLYSFILKDAKEFRRSRKMLLFALICTLYPTIINIIATRPLIPIQYLIIPASILTACFGGELVYFFTINEIKQRIFDVFLISKIGRLQLLLCKIAFPFLYSFLLALLSIVINNIVAMLLPHYGFVSGLLSFETIALFISGATISSLIQFGAIMIIGELNDHLHTFTLFMSFLLLISIYAANLILAVSAFFVIITAIIVVLILLNYSLINLYRQKTLFREHNNQKSIFPDRNISDISALLRKEIILSGSNFSTIIRLIISSAFPILINLFTINNIELLQALSRITLYFVCNFGILNILFPVITTEQIGKHTDVFRVAGISKFKLYLSKCILPFFTMSAGLISSFLLIWIYTNKTDSIFPFNYAAVITSFFSTLCSILISFWLSRFIYSYKDVHIVRFFISLVSFIFHIIISFIPYWFL